MVTPAPKRGKVRLSEYTSCRPTFEEKDTVLAAQDTSALRAGARPEAADLLQKICAKVLVPYGLKEVADRAVQAADDGRQRNTVILVGEVNRGKSALANALVGVPDATPAGSDFTTVIPVALGPATAEVPAGNAALIAGGRCEIINASELRNFVSSGQTPPRDFLPTRAYVALERSALGSVTVIDAPGIGGIESLAALPQPDTQAQASVIVVVTDASSPLTRPEMEFLRSASDTHASVVVAVTKTDKNLTRYRAIIRKDVELIDEHVGRDIPVFPVSSIVQFLTEFDPAGIHAEVEVSGTQLAGVEALRRDIARRFSRAASLPLANGLRIASIGLAQIDQQLLERSKAATAAEDALPELERQQAQLSELNRTKNEWQEFLVRDLSMARQEASSRLDADLSAVRTRWDSFIRTHGMQVLRRNPQHYTRLIEEDFQRSVLENVEQFSAQIVEIIRQRFSDPGLAESITEEIMEGFAVSERESASLERNLKDAFDPALLTMGVSGGAMLGSMLGATVFTGAFLIAGLGWFAVNAGFRSMKQSKTQLQQWLREATVSTSKHTLGIFDRIIAQARAVIVVRYRTHLKQQIDELSATRNRLLDAQQTEEQEREREHKRVIHNRRVVMDLQERAEALVEALLEEATQPRPTQEVE
ncbi:hypothetical protein D8M31_09015 [Corynebacterium genitalium]|nr:hypothetical protein D8M31_09015 [Corynebacterium genitalium]